MSIRHALQHDRKNVSYHIIVYLNVHHPSFNVIPYRAVRNSARIAAEVCEV